MHAISVVHDIFGCSNSFQVLGINSYILENGRVEATPLLLDTECEAGLVLSGALIL